MTAGEIVRREREAAGWTQAQLAASSGIDAGRISRMESGKRMLSLAGLQRVFAALGVSLSVFDAQANSSVD